MAEYGKWASVPPGEQNLIASLADSWESTIGYKIPIAHNPKLMLQLANANISTLADIGKIAQTWGGSAATTLSAMPWAKYGIDKDTYTSMATTFGTEYKKVTGQDITPGALQQAFQNPKDLSGGLLTASQYSQQLMNDAGIQKQYGWVKYGLDFAAWTQQKLSMRSTYGRDINDSEAATILQYTKTATGSNMSAVAHQTGQQSPSPAGVGQSVAR